MEESMFLGDLNITKFEMTRIDIIRSEVKKINSRFKKYIENLQARITKDWEEEEKKDKANISRDTAQRKLERFMEHAKMFRLKVLDELTEEIYRDCWYVRSELEMSVSIFKMGVFSTYVNYNPKWEKNQNETLRPIVLRLAKPKKPKKKKFGIKDVAYDIFDAIQTMLKPISEKLEEAESNLKKISVIKSLIEIEKNIGEKITSGEDFKQIEDEYKKEIKRIHEKKAPFTKYYRKLIISRNIMTQITQSVSPRVTYLDFREKLLSDHSDKIPSKLL